MNPTNTIFLHPLHHHHHSYHRQRLHALSHKPIPSPDLCPMKSCRQKTAHPGFQSGQHQGLRCCQGETRLITTATPHRAGTCSEMLAVQQSRGSCGSGWRNWFPKRAVAAAAEAPVPPAAPVTPALNAALERGSGPAPLPNRRARPSSDQGTLGKSLRRRGTWSGRTNQRT